MIRQVTCAVVAASLAAACAREPAAPSAPPQRIDTVLPVESRIIQALVPRQATLETLLRQHQLPAALIQAAIEASSAVFNPRHFRAERPYRLVLSVDGLLKEFEYQIDTDRFLRILCRDTSAPEKLEAEVLPYEKQREIIAIRGRIDSDHPSLIAAMEAAGARLQLAIELADIFGGEVDFENDLQPGDLLEVLVESTTYEGQFAGYGPIVGARLVNEGHQHQAIRWVNPSTQKAGYYDEQGRSLKRFVLASPLKFMPRVTSGFSRSRLHPVFHDYRAHLGVDYAAAPGTPVVAVADGVVLSADWAGGGGRQVHIRHASGLESYYLHLSAFGAGIHGGAHVQQGQMIGRVGSSGTATGPHLDYRLRKNGVFVDPRREHAKQPPGEPIPAALLAAFGDVRDDVREQLTAKLMSSPVPGGDAVPAKH
jgi:murein DD-endopeptidase MepM/ murein hydrolase activator NlpD